jgi:hypothetical protein
MVTYSEHIVIDQTDFDSEIHLYSFIYSTIWSINLYKWWKMSPCGGSGGLPTYIAFIYSMDQSLLILFIYSIDQKKVFGERYLVVVAADVFVGVW